MTHDQEMTAALAAADRHLALVKDTLNHMVDEARELLSRYDETSAWALLGEKVKQQLDCTEGRSYFSAEMVAAAAIQLAKAS